MKCSKCGEEFPESELQESHDVPTYLFEGETHGDRKSQTDKFSRRYLCKKHHDIYEKTLIAVMVRPLPIEIKLQMIKTAVSFSKKYFKEENNDTNT